MGCDALEEGQGVADPVGLVGRQGRRVNGRINVDNLLREKKKWR